MVLPVLGPPTVSADHVGASAGVVQELHADGVEIAPPDPLVPVAPGHIRPSLLNWPQRRPSCGGPSRRRVRADHRHRDGLDAAADQIGRMLAKAMTLRPATSSRSRSSCPASKGLRWPPTQIPGRGCRHRCRLRSDRATFSHPRNQIHLSNNFGTDSIKQDYAPLLCEAYLLTRREYSMNSCHWFDAIQQLE